MHSSLSHACAALRLCSAGAQRCLLLCALQPHRRCALGTRSGRRPQCCCSVLLPAHWLKATMRRRVTQRRHAGMQSTLFAQYNAAARSSMRLAIITRYRSDQSCRGAALACLQPTMRNGAATASSSWMKSTCPSVSLPAEYKLLSHFLLPALHSAVVSDSLSLPSAPSAPPSWCPSCAIVARRL